MKKKSCFQVAASLLAAVGGAVSIYALFVRPWHLGWGATDEEQAKTLPGDDLVPDPKLQATHAVTIHAPPTAVWPWLVQLGQGRGGFYSYDFLENAMGLEIHSADQILPEFQNLKVGDIVPLEPGGEGPPVVILEPENALVLGGTIDSESEGAFMLTDKDPEAYFQTSWGFYLEPEAEDRTRLIERFRLDWNPSPVNTFFYRVVLEPGSFIMERKMLLGIKERAEKHWEYRA